MKLTTRSLAIIGIFAALVSIATLVLRIPSPAGYIHMGDSLVYISGILLGPIYGALASAIGSGLSDLFGYAEYVPATFVIKGLDAFMTAYVFYMVQKRVKGLQGAIIGYVLGVLLGGVIMIGGYFLYDTMLKGTAVALASVSYNVAQAVGGAIIGLPLLVALEKSKVTNILNPMRS